MMDNRGGLYRKMLLIRRFEESILELFSKGKIRGTTHTYNGQEANAVALAQHLKPQDIIVSHHRSHGHFLARFQEPYPLYAEILGKKTGVSGGRGGSQHLCYKNFYSNGILGGMSATAAGMALAEKKKKSGAMVVFFATDGMMGEGLVYEVLNMVSLWQLPLLVVVENNRYSQSTPYHLGVSGRIINRGRAFDIEASEIETFDVLQLIDFFSEIVPKVRSGKPYFAVIHTYRFGPHSKGDDFRDPAEIENFKKQDPLRILADRIPSEEVLRVQGEVNALLETSMQQAMSDPFPEVEIEKLGPSFIEGLAGRVANV